MHEWQQYLKHKDFNKKSRSWHIAHVFNLCGSKHIASAVIKYGEQTPEALLALLEAIKNLKQEDADAEPEQFPTDAAEQRRLRKEALYWRGLLRQARAIWSRRKRYR